MHSRIELNVAVQVEAVSDMVGVAQDLRLWGIALRPNPFLLQIVRELIGVLHALYVAACARVAVPIPGAADTTSGLEDAHGETDPTQAVQHVHASETGTDDHSIKCAGLLQLQVRLLIRHTLSPCSLMQRVLVARICKARWWQPNPKASSQEQRRHRQACRPGRPLPSSARR